MRANLENVLLTQSTPIYIARAYFVSGPYSFPKLCIIEWFQKIDSPCIYAIKWCTIKSLHKPIVKLKMVVTWYSQDADSFVCLFLGHGKPGVGCPFVGILTTNKKGWLPFKHSYLTPYANINTTIYSSFNWKQLVMWNLEVWIFDHFKTNLVKDVSRYGRSTPHWFC